MSQPRWLMPQEAAACLVSVIERPVRCSTCSLTDISYAT